MFRTFSRGIRVQEAAGVFHSLPGMPVHTAGPIALSDSRHLPVMGNSVAKGASGSQSQWQYVNVRHFVLFIEQSLSQGCQWAVFQNNGPTLWSRVARTLDQFLANQWLQGSLRGKKKHEAYFVRCDSSTMSQADLDAGRLVAVVGLAPLQPAEFVVIQIGLQTGQSRRPP